MALLTGGRPVAECISRTSSHASFSSPCETSRKHANACEHEPRLCAGDCGLEVLARRGAVTKVRSTQRFRSGLKVPTLCLRVTISMVHLPSSAIALSTLSPGGHGPRRCAAA